MFPDMVTGYTAEGNAIIALKGNVEELTKAYEANAQAARQSLIASGEKIFDNFKSKLTNDTAWAWDDEGAVVRQQFVKQILDAYNQRDEELLKTLHDNTNLRNQVFEAAGADIWAGRSQMTGNVTSWDGMQNSMSALQSYYKTIKKSTICKYFCGFRQKRGKFT
jgi:formylmethanofuran dehydrogenase subunit C